MATATSVTRSRRAEGLRHSQAHPTTNGKANANSSQHSSGAAAAAAAATAGGGQHGQQLVANAKTQNKTNVAANNNSHPRATKRHLDSSARDCDPVVVKKARFTTGIAVEIPARPSLQSRAAREAAAAAAACDAKSQTNPNKPVATGGSEPPNGSRAPPKTAAVAKAVGASTSTSKPNQQPKVQQNGLTRHREKVFNGLKHELDRLQPGASAEATKDSRRKLRSQEQTRFKSELSVYFADYDEVIGNERKEQHLLNIGTPIIVVSGDSSPALAKTSAKNTKQSLTNSHQSQPIDTTRIRSYSDALFTNLWGSQTVDFGFLGYKGKSLEEDPLPDSVFQPIHKKLERSARSYRNAEKGRAQHERDQIIRLLDGLQGPDWLRVLGVSGITESRKKQYEPARQHFINGCQVVLEKFRKWAAEEKRRKQEKDRAHQAEKRAASEESHRGKVESKGGSRRTSGGRSSKNGGGATDQEDHETSREIVEIPDSDDEMADGVGSREGDDSDGDPPDYSDVDASIAKQLREEAIAAAKKSSASKRGRKRRATDPPAAEAAPPPAAEPYKEFTSFFEKKYQREAALNKTRRKGRKVMAWGQTVPELPEMEFEMPEELLDEETLKAHARRKRRAKRHRQS